MAGKQQKPKPPATVKAGSAKDRIIDAALQIAALQGWETCTVRDIVQEAGLKLPEFYEHFEERGDVVAAYERRLDRAVLENFAEPDYEADPRDRLFDILMERLDLANQNRAGVISILNSYRLDPKQLVCGCPHLAQSMTRMLEAASLDTAGLRGAARVAGLTLLYMWALRTWLKDDSDDLAKTMSVLDKGLSRLERAANNFGF